MINVVPPLYIATKDKSSRDTDQPPELVERVHEQQSHQKVKNCTLVDNIHLTYILEHRAPIVDPDGYNKDRYQEQRCSICVFGREYHCEQLVSEKGKEIENGKDDP